MGLFSKRKQPAAAPAVRTIDELVVVDVPGWKKIDGYLNESSLRNEVVPFDDDRRRAVLAGLQVTVASGMGALVWNCAAILVDHGWVRLLGSGVGDLPPIHMEQLSVPGSSSFEGVVVAYDVLGGVFAVHGHGFTADPGEICYWAPDTLDWTPLGFGHFTLIEFLLSDGLAEFYSDLRWDGWESDTDALVADQGISAYPFPFSAEGRPGNDVSRTPAPLAEVVRAGFEFAAQLG